MRNFNNGKLWIVFAVGTGSFISSYGISSVNAVLPVISTSLNENVEAIAWVVIVYQLVVSGLLLSFGRLGDIKGNRSVYHLGLFLYMFTSLMCGLAATANALIFFRAIQGIGAAMILANTPALLTNNFPQSQFGQALGLRAVLTYLGIMTGPILGGWFASQFSWRYLFFINVPLGLFALFMSLHFIPPDYSPSGRGGFDAPGAVVFMLGLWLFVLTINQGSKQGSISMNNLVFLGLSGLLLFLFLFIEERSQYPMLDLNLFKNRIFSSSVTSAIFNFACSASITFLLPFYLIRGLDLSPTKSGFILMAQPLIMLTVAPISGTLSDKLGTRLLSTLGLMILGVGLYLLSLLGPQSSLSSILISISITGLGAGFFISPNNSSLMKSVPRDMQGVAGSIVATARTLGQGFGIVISSTVFAIVLSHGQAIGSSNALFEAIRQGFSVMIGLAAIGSITSVIRGASA